MNKVVLIGRLTRDPELRTTPSGVSAANFSLAVNRNFRNKEGGIDADFFNITAWRRQAENISKYCMKGSQVCVEGRLQTRNYEAQDGTRRYVTDIVADNVEFLSRPNNASSGSQNNFQSNGYFADVPAGNDNPVETTVTNEDPFKDFGSEVVLTDDDLPF